MASRSLLASSLFLFKPCPQNLVQLSLSGLVLFSPPGRSRFVTPVKSRSVLAVKSRPSLVLVLSHIKPVGNQSEQITWCTTVLGFITKLHYRALKDNDSVCVCVCVCVWYWLEVNRYVLLTTRPDCAPSLLLNIPFDCIRLDTAAKNSFWSYTYIVANNMVWLYTNTVANNMIWMYTNTVANNMIWLYTNTVANLIVRSQMLQTSIR